MHLRSRKDHKLMLYLCHLGWCPWNFTNFIHKSLTGDPVFSYDLIEIKSCSAECCGSMLHGHISMGNSHEGRTLDALGFLWGYMKYHENLSFMKISVSDIIMNSWWSHEEWYHTFRKIWYHPDIHCPEILTWESHETLVTSWRCHVLTGRALLSLTPSNDGVN